ncbi:MAG: sugar phosphate isomerase/epimerase family protein [Mariniblastus sp.]
MTPSPQRNAGAKKSIDRRRFLSAIAVGGSGVLLSTPNVVSQEPLRSVDQGHVQFALAAYSFRKHFAFMKGKPQTPEGKSINMFEFVDYCASQKCAAELTSYFFPPDADEEYFLRLKRHAYLMGVPIVGTAIGNNFTLPKGERLDKEIADAKKWIDRAAVLGAPHIRFFAGTRKQLEASAEAKTNAIQSLQTCVDYAAGKGVFIGVENHGDLTADQVLEIVRSVKGDWFGVNLDTGNFFSDDPYRDIAMCLPFAVNIQFKVKMKDTEKKPYEADFDRIAKIIVDSKYRGYVVFEYEEPNAFERVPTEFGKMRAAFDAVK